MNQKIPPMSSQKKNVSWSLNVVVITYILYLNPACEQDIWGALRVVDGRELARRLFFILLDVFISDIF